MSLLYDIRAVNTLSQIMRGFFSCLVSFLKPVSKLNIIYVILNCGNAFVIKNNLLLGYLTYDQL